MNRCGGFMENSQLLPEVRCQKCGRLLFKGIIEAVEIKCPRCGALQRYLRTGLRKECKQIKMV